MIGYPDDNSYSGEMYLKPGDSYSINITQIGQWGKLSGLNKGCESNIIVDELAGEFKIQKAGDYKFDGVASIFPSSGMLLDFAVFVNDVFQENINTQLDFKNNQDTNTFSGTGVMALDVGDVVDVRGMSDTQPVTVNITAMNINLHRAGAL